MKKAITVILALMFVLAFTACAGNNGGKIGAISGDESKTIGVGFLETETNDDTDKQDKPDESNQDDNKTDENKSEENNPDDNKPEDETNPQNGETEVAENPETEPETQDEGEANSGKQGVKIGLFIVLLLFAVVITYLISVIKQHPQQAELSPTGELEPTKQPDITPVTVASLSGNIAVRIAKFQNIGRRKNQEDAFGISDTNDAALCSAKGTMAVVADGMGGLNNGEVISNMAVESMLEGFADKSISQTGEAELHRLLKNTVDKANKYLESNGGLKKSGSTLMAAIINGDRLSWISVGDSRISLFRNGRLTDLNSRHNYGAELDRMVRQNKILPEQAIGNPNREKVTSYIGMGKLKYIDISQAPMQLFKNDKVILMSDGIFNTLSDAEIANILSLPTDIIAGRLEAAVLAKNNPYQDNFTAVVLEPVSG